MMARKILPPQAVTVSCALERWNLAEAGPIPGFCAERGLVLSAETDRTNGKFPNCTCLRGPRYRDYVERPAATRKQNELRINGTPMLLAVGGA